MLIELANHNFKVTWPKYPREVHQEIVRRLKTISGASFDRELKCWWVPIAQGAKLLDFFWRASYSVDAICAAIDAESNQGRHFYQSLVLMGIELHIDEAGAIVAAGEGVSPLIQQLVDERSAALRPLVQMQRPQPKVTAQPVAQLQGPKSEEDLKWESWLTGVQNAAQKAKEETKRHPWQRRKQKPQQGSLFND